MRRAEFHRPTAGAEIRSSCLCPVQIEFLSIAGCHVRVGRRGAETLAHHRGFEWLEPALKPDLIVGRRIADRRWRVSRRLSTITSTLVIRHTVYLSIS